MLLAVAEMCFCAGWGTVLEDTGARFCIRREGAKEYVSKSMSYCSLHPCSSLALGAKAILYLIQSLSPFQVSRTITLKAHPSSTQKARQNPAKEARVKVSDSQRVPVQAVELDSRCGRERAGGLVDKSLQRLNIGCLPAAYGTYCYGIS